MNKDNEQREIKQWEEFPKYEVGDDGTVFSRDYNHTGKSKVLHHHLDQDGYAYVVLVVNGKRYKRSVHRMVALSFIPNPQNKAQVNHKNGIRNDNRVENLEWNTPRENVIHGYKVNGRKASEKTIARGKETFGGSNNPKAKLNEAEVLCIKRLRAKGTPLKDIAERIGISTAQVSSIARGKSWSHLLI